MTALYWEFRDSKIDRDTADCAGRMLVRIAAQVRDTEIEERLARLEARVLP